MRIERMDKETRALIRSYNPRMQTTNSTVLFGHRRRMESDASNRTILVYGIDFPEDQPRIHQVAHRKTWEERYHARTYAELRGERE